jgi:hypothetical protein
VNKFQKQSGYYINVLYTTDKSARVDIGKAFTENKKSASYIIESGDDGFIRLFTVEDNIKKQIFILENYGVNLIDATIKKLLSVAKSRCKFNIDKYVTINR